MPEILEAEFVVELGGEALWVKLVAGGEQTPELVIVFNRFGIVFEADRNDDFSCPGGAAELIIGGSLRLSFWFTLHLPGSFVATPIFGNRLSEYDTNRAIVALIAVPQIRHSQPVSILGLFGSVSRSAHICRLRLPG